MKQKIVFIPAKGYPLRTRAGSQGELIPRNLRKNLDKSAQMRYTYKKTKEITTMNRPSSTALFTYSYLYFYWNTGCLCCQKIAG